MEVYYLMMIISKILSFKLFYLPRHLLEPSLQVMQILNTNSQDHNVFNLKKTKPQV